MIGTHTVALIPDASGTGTEIDLSCFVDTVTTHHGRDETTGQPDASTCTLDISTDTGVDPLPDGLEIGSWIRVATEWNAIPYTRFRGRIVDIVYSWDDTGEETPDSLLASIIAAGTLSDLGRRVVGAVPFPQELDGARVGRVLSLSGVTLDPAFSDPGTVQILPRDIDAQPALTVAQETANSAGGLVWQTRKGEVRYADADHRRGQLPLLELDACDMLVAPQWSRTTEGLMNAVSIGYGVAPDGGEQPSYVASDPTSQGRYGRYEYAAGTTLALLADAEALGQLLLVRNSSPVWIMSTLPVDVAGLDPARTAILLSLDMHDLLSLTGLPISGGAPTTAALWIEGWDERLAAGEHELSLAVTGYCRTVPPPRWDDLDPALTWNTWTGTWDDQTCIGPQPYRGRWNDLPASLRWDQIPPSTTWDNWTGG